MDEVTFSPTGFFLGHSAWRHALSGVTQAPFPLFWDITKS